MKLTKHLEPSWNRLLWFLQWAQFRPASLNSKRWANVRSAKNTIELCQELGIEPLRLFDVGANDGQWAYWLKKQWPHMRVEAFEPNINAKPIGNYHGVALSDVSGEGALAGTDTSSHVVDGSCVKVVRFDEYWIGVIPRRSILKIDAEHHSARALIGFGERIRFFDLVIVEICWDNFRSGEEFKGQAAVIMQFMFANGFTNMASVDEAVYSGRTDFSDMAFWK